MTPEVEALIRNLKVPQLEVLKIICNSIQPVATTQEISDTTGTATYTLGALIAPLRRLKVNDEPLILKAGEDVNEGARWQINSKLISKLELKELLVSMEI